MDRDDSAPLPPRPRAALVCPTATGLLLPPVDAAEVDGKSSKTTKRRADMDSSVAPLAFPTGIDAGAAEDGKKKAKKRRAAVMDSSHSPRVGVAPAPLVCPTGLPLPLPPAVDAAEDGVVVVKKKKRAYAPRALPLPPPLLGAAVEQAEGCKKKMVAVVAAEGGKNQQKLRETLLKQALGALPPPLDSRIRAEHGGGDYDPYSLDLFLYRRAVPPWDFLWESRPLVLHDRRLVDTLDAMVMWPWYLSDEPRDQEEAVTRVLGHHPGPISSFRLHCSVCPDTEGLGRWMDALSRKGAVEVVILNLYRDATATRFPLRRLNTSSLTVLALGFFRIGAEEISDCTWCEGVSSLTTLSLTGCTFPVSALSAAVCRLGCLRMLTVTSCNLSLAGRDGGRHEDRESLIIDSMSLRHLRLCSCAGKKLTIEYAPLLAYLELTIGFMEPRPLPSNGKRENLSPTSPLWASPSISAYQLKHNAQVLAELLSQFPALSELTLSRVDDLPADGNDDLSVSESWFLSPLPKCLGSSLQKLIISDYRGGAAELALLASLLQAAADLVSIIVFPHSSIDVSQEEAIATQIQALPRASKKRDISILIVSANSSQ